MLAKGGNTITNTTTAATGDQDDPSTVGDDLEETVAVGVPAADLVTVKTLASGDATPDEGDTVTFEISVTNNGADAATNVSLTDLLPAGITYTTNTTTQGSYDLATGLWTIGTIANGDAATITLTGTVDAGEGGNTITNITTAAVGDQVDPSTVGDDLEESVIVNDAADLVTVKTLASGDATPAEGDTITFDITVTNNGAAQATNVSLTDSIPAGFTLTGNTTTQGSYTGGLWTIGTLNAGSTATITLTGTIDAGQAGNTITNVTTAATGDQLDPSTVGDDLDESVVVEDNTTDLITVKTLASGDSTPDVGDIVTFDISVTNDGPAQATNVSLTDFLPIGLTPTANNGTSNDGGSYDPATGVWTIGTLDSGATVSLTLQGTVDAGQGGNTITNITTAAVGDQVDPSTDGDDLDESVTVEIFDVPEPAIGLAKEASNVAINGDNFDVTFTLAWQNIGETALDNVQILDDVANLFGAQFVGIVPGSVAITSFSGAGNAPTVNAAFEGDTTQSLITSNGPLEIGDAFQVVFTTTIDPDAEFSFDGLVNQATSTGDAVDALGVSITDEFGTPLTAFDDSDNGTDTLGENGEDNGDGTFANDVTPVQIADIGVAKSIAGEPEVLANGNSVVTFQVVVQNTGTVDLGSLSLVEDIATQFGDAFISASNLTLTAGPTGPTSNIALASDAAGFNGATVTELLDQSIDNRLEIGDSFTIEFTVEVDPAGTTGTLENQVVGNGAGIDQDGNAVFDADGNQIFAHDLSDSGTDPGGVNADQGDDNGTSDDPSLFTPAQRGLSQISGTVFNDLNNDGIQDAGEAGIEGVEIRLTGQDVNGNQVELTTFTDANGNYSFDGLVAGTYSVFQIQPDGFDDGIENSDAADSVEDNRLNDITLGFNQSFANNTFGEVQQNISGSVNGTSGSPARLPPIIGVGRPLNNMISNFLGGPGLIYSGIPIASNANPLTLQSNRPVSGGYSSGFAAPTQAGGIDCGCAEVVEAPYDNAVPYDAQMDQPYAEDCNVCQDATDQVFVDESFVNDAAGDGACQTCQEFAPCNDCSDCGNCCDCGGSAGRGGFLFRMKNWLHR